MPFEGDYEAAIMYSIMNDEPEPLDKYESGIPEGLQTIISKALEKKPEDRYQDLKETLNDFEQVKQGLEPDQKLSHPKKSKPKRKKMHWVKKTFLTFGIILFLII